MAKKTNKVPALPSNIFKSVNDLNPEGGAFDDSCLSTPTDWIDTGSMALNAILSGSLYKGVPVGRIVGLSGNSGAGKTLIANKILANAQKKGYIAVIWDSEIAVDKDSAKNVGMDLSKAMYYPVDTVEQCRNQISNFLDNVIEAKAAKPEEDYKFIISIDSLGNLASEKELKDAAADKSSQDMGQKAKMVKSMMRIITYKAAKAGVPIVFTNHVYDDPSSMFPTQIKTQSGGKGPIYLASVLVQLSTTLEKISENTGEQSIGAAHNISGVTISALTVKNRIVPPFLKTQLYLNFRTGLHPTAGLFDLADSMGVIERDGKSYKLVATGENLGFRSKFEKDVDVWVNKINPHLEQKLQEELRYNSDTPDEFDANDEN